MAVQKYTAMEKTSIQLRHTLKRLDVLIEVSKDETECALAKLIRGKIDEARKLIPAESQDVDLKEKE